MEAGKTHAHARDQFLRVGSTPSLVRVRVFFTPSYVPRRLIAVLAS